jgi:hypothetical protein
LSPTGNPMIRLKCHHGMFLGIPLYIVMLTFSCQRLEVPFILQPDTDFQCIDASGTTADSWLEMPLRPDRPIPVRCAVSVFFIYNRPSCSWKAELVIDHLTDLGHLLTFIVNTLFCCFHNNSSLGRDGERNCCRRDDLCVAGSSDNRHGTHSFLAALSSTNALKRGIRRSFPSALIPASKAPASRRAFPAPALSRAAHIRRRHHKPRSARKAAAPDTRLDFVLRYPYDKARYVHRLSEEAPAAAR